MDNALVQPDPGLFFWTIAVFLVLLFLLKRFAWGPLLAALDERQAGIRKSLDDADQARKELEQVREEAEAIIGKARAEADGIISDARADGGQLRDDLRQQAQQQAQAIVENAERQIQQERDRALQQIRQEAVDMSLMIASKLIRRNLTAEDNASLIDEALKQVQPPPQG
ncbi:MAG: F0F1 ATP synthase subunit B [Acidobacteria bacterium]|nr:F0F1 ATP synthase subunit B [Acidobacteriota bacterium]